MMQRTPNRGLIRSTNWTFENISSFARDKLKWKVMDVMGLIFASSHLHTTNRNASNHQASSRRTTFDQAPFTKSELGHGIVNSTCLRFIAEPSLRITSTGFPPSHTDKLFQLAVPPALSAVPSDDRRNRQQ
ncbi:predicted protein [Uncinocarpus reesii 1704]|uniref:Uncharacterized protein n=1 Tax=Uncinocarpus reesii (strain UAMH 1704) TaxID=336963 RepID=C4JN02_UNCRE|nr:uncharacterized protein UREG_04210 [Uncinocarpus reesii 1704]EEP79364.1 predicted protein [Uncinocarpus reesii 1704]